MLDTTRDTKPAPRQLNFTVVNPGLIHYSHRHENNEKFIGGSFTFYRRFGAG
jgi:hypothetical protein